MSRFCASSRRIPTGDIFYSATARNVLDATRRATFRPAPYRSHMTSAFADCSPRWRFGRFARLIDCQSVHRLEMVKLAEERLNGIEKGRRNFIRNMGRCSTSLCVCGCLVSAFLSRAGLKRRGGSGYWESPASPSSLSKQSMTSIPVCIASKVTGDHSLSRLGLYCC